jgi:hypothetical protein
MRNNEMVVNGQVKVFGRPGGRTDRPCHARGLHARYPKLYCSVFVVPAVKGVVLALPFFVFHNAAIYTTLSAALFHNRNSVTVEKNDGEDGKVSRTLYKGLFYRAGPEFSMLPRT